MIRNEKTRDNKFILLEESLLLKNIFDVEEVNRISIYPSFPSKSKKYRGRISWQLAAFDN